MMMVKRSRQRAFHSCLTCRKPMLRLSIPCALVCQHTGEEILTDENADEFVPQSNDWQMAHSKLVEQTVGSLEWHLLPGHIW